MKNLGIIVARFQVPELHVGHKYLIEEAAKRSDVLVIFLGYKVNQPDVKNPFSVAMRKAMVEAFVKTLSTTCTIVVDSLHDHPVSNELWSTSLDEKIGALEEIYGKCAVTLYGSRDSFIAYYKGVHSHHVLETRVEISGTEMRNAIISKNEEELTAAHREGYIYGLSKLYPVGMSVVDILVYTKEGGDIKVLLGRKPRETKWRLIGGFFDVDQDESLEEAALRELCEEVGDVVVRPPVYVTSKKIDDWRYRNNQHKIVSSLFVAEYVSGTPIPGDDIEEVVWVSVECMDLEKITEGHRQFVLRATEKLKSM